MRDKKEELHELPDIEFVKFELQEKTSLWNVWQVMVYMKERSQMFSPRDFWPPFCHDSNPSRPLMNSLKYFRIRFLFCRDTRSQSLKISTPQCAWHRGVKILGLVNPLFILQIFSFMIDVFTPQIYFSWLFLLKLPFTINSDSGVCSLTLRCDAHRSVFKDILFSWLSGVMHNPESDSVVWYTPRSLTPRYDAHRGDWLCSIMYIVEFFLKNSNI